MLAAFIDFKKAYARVDHIKLWSCLEGAGLEERKVEFLKAAYQECKCEVKVGDMVSGSFDVVKGLRKDVCCRQCSSLCTSTLWVCRMVSESEC